MNANAPSTVNQDQAVVGLRVNLIHNSIDRALVLYELKRKDYKRFNHIHRFNLSFFRKDNFCLQLLLSSSRFSILKNK